jgi:hypothetical protein
MDSAFSYRNYVMQDFRKWIPRFLTGELWKPNFEHPGVLCVSGSGFETFKMDSGFFLPQPDPYRRNRVSLQKPYK